MTSPVRGVLYIGVTADLPARVAQHRAGKGSAFCRKYRLRRLVLAEHHDSIEDAIRPEKLLETWKRAWKSFRWNDGKGTNDDQRLRQPAEADAYSSAGLLWSWM